MRTLLFTVAAACFAAVAAEAQTNPVSSALTSAFDAVGRNVTEAAEAMPESEYGFQPTPEVRTFGQLVGHVANAQYRFCSGLVGEQSPATANFEQELTSKADLVKAMQDATAYCASAYAGVTDARLAEMVPLFGSEMPAGAVMANNTSHSNEHYGNMVTYLRIKGIVPPSTARQSMD